MSARYRMKINLEEFFHDERKFSYILIKPEWEYVNDVKQHIKKLFSLKSINLITEDTFYLPVHESIEVINKEEIIKVIKKRKGTDTSGIDHKSNGAFSSATTSNLTEIQNPQSHDDSLKKKKRRKITDVNNSLQNEVQQYEEKTDKTKLKEFSNTVAEAAHSVDKCKNFLENANKKIKSTFNNDLEEENTTVETIPEHQQTENQIQTKETINGEIFRKRKRKRRSKRKNKELNNENNAAQQFQSVQNKIKPTPQKSTTITTANHVRFSEDGAIIQANKEEEEEESGKIVFKSYLDDIPMPRYIRGIGKHNLGTTNVINLEENIKEKQNTEFEQVNESEITLNDDINPESIKITTNGKDEEAKKINKELTIAINDSVTETGKETITIPYNGSSEKLINIEDCLKFSKPLDTLPAIEDILIFKIYRLNEKYEPGLSEYICGKVEEIESDTNFIKILIIEGQEQFKPVEGKFSMPTTSTEELDNYVYLKLEDMIDKNVFKL